MGYYDYTLAYQNGKLSDFLYEKAPNFDFNKDKKLNDYEYSQFQKWFTKDDIEKYSLDVIEFTRKDRINYFKEKALPDNIKNNDIISDKEKKTLKLLNIISGIGAIAGVGGATAMTTVALKGAIGAVAAFGLPVATVGTAVALVAGLGAYAYKNHLENKIEKNSQYENAEVQNSIKKEISE